MTLTYGFYDSLSGDRKYNADQMSRLFEGIITDGIFQSIGQTLVVSVNTGMTVSVGTGRAWLKNTWTNNDSALVLTVLASESVLNRIDTVVVEVNKDIGTRANSIKIVKGTPASTPAVPTLADTSTLKQYPLAHIYVAANASSILAGNITNKVGSSETPFITGVLQSVNIATLLAQFESNFNVWLGGLQDQLDDNQAGNLQNQINTLFDQNYGWIKVTETWTYATANSVTYPTGGASRFKKGMGVRLKQGGSWKYFYLTNPANTVGTLSGGSDFTIANDAITDIYVSLTPGSAIGFPTTFALAPITWNLITVDNGSGGQPTAEYQYFTMDSTYVYMRFRLGAAGVYKVTSDNAIASSVLPATLPPITDGALAPIGNSYAAVAPNGLVGVIAVAGPGGFYLRYADNIADNTLVPYAGGDIKYRY